ncbi:MAG: GGDEF domain-containing protein, partial [Methylobacterium sp.]
MIRKRGSWGEGELYEALCLLMIGACLWIIGIQFQVFSSLNAFIHANDLSNAFMLVALMGLAVFAASLRKSLLLRVAMRERDLTAAEAEAVARHDVLTGLANRRLFLETLERRRAAASLVPTQAVLLVDLDRFKPVNDIYGHAAGNAVLCAVAERLSALTPEGGLAA